MKILVIDNYDSFVFNLVHYLHALEVEEVVVVKNDQFTLDYPEQFDKILLSPGPGLPEEAGLMMQVIHKYASSKSILGVCLGHQALGLHFGAQLENLSKPLHGMTSEIKVKNSGLFIGLPNTFKVGHYHSWVVKEETLPNTSIQITAKTPNGLVMAMQHQTLPIFGVQFHPESILTEHGHAILRNWLQFKKFKKS